MSTTGWSAATSSSTDRGSTSEEGINGEIAASGQPNTLGTSESVTVRGANGIFRESPERTKSVGFFENNVEVTIFSPSLSEEELISIAEAMK